MTHPLSQPLTLEQHRIVRSTARRLRVQAYAGTGKTATLVAYAQARPDQRILYLAFNKPIQREAARRFPSHVKCLTTHALAYRRVGRAFHEAGRLGSLGAGELMDRFDLAPVDARRVLDTLESFLRSADRRPSGRHVPADLVESDRTPVVRLATRAWEAMQAREGDLPMTHDGYLKLYQLSRPDLSQAFDLLLFDEAQDANEVTLELIGQQPIPQVVVGDTHQSIYAFRGAVDALGRFEAGETLRLTQSFRFGPGIAAVATALLAGLKGEAHPVVGQTDRETEFEVDRSRPYTVIARTNATVFDEAVSLLGTTRFHLIGGVASYLLSAGEHHDPLVALLEAEESHSRDVAEPTAGESLAGAYLYLLRRFDNRMAEVAAHLLISVSYCYRRCAEARCLAAFQQPLPPEALTTRGAAASMTGPWRRFRIVRASAQLCFEFESDASLFEGA